MGILPRGRGESISTCLDRNLADTPHCPYLGPRQQIHCWQAMGADNVLLRGIAKGVKAPLHHIPAPKSPRPPPPGYHQETMTTIGEYLKSGVIRHLTPKEVVNTKYWVPAFPRPKKDSHKIRLITDLRDLNACHQVPKHKTETWRSILQFCKVTCRTGH